MTRKKYDLAIIGAGAAGLSLAAGAAQLGLRVVLIEAGKMGGDCLNSGCVPSKSLLAAAKAAYAHHHGEKLGVRTTDPKIDFSAVRRHVHDTIAAIAPHDSIERFEGLGVTVIQGRATFANTQKTLDVNGQHITARHIVIATGSRPTIPDISGLAASRPLTNETIFDLAQLPTHLVILGGGAIGIEMAMAFRRLGSRVSLIQRRSILPQHESVLVDILRRQLIAEGIALHEHTNLVAVTNRQDGGSLYRLDNGTHIEDASHCLVATGRTPNIADLGLAQAGIATNAHGIIVNSRQQTSQKRIWAIGDVGGDGVHFTHLAGYHAGIVLRQIAFALPAHTNTPHLPQAIYTDPELAQCGMTEHVARSQFGTHIRVLEKSFADLDRARCEGRIEGRIKIILRPNGKILGAGIVGPNAGELIAPWGLAIQRGLSIGTIASTMPAYPTWHDINRAIASDFFKPKLFSPLVRGIVRVTSSWS